MRTLQPWLAKTNLRIKSLYHSVRLPVLTALLFAVIVLVIAWAGMLAINILFEYFGWKTMPYKVAVVFTAIGFGINELVSSRREDS